MVDPFWLVLNGNQKKNQPFRGHLLGETHLVCSCLQLRHESISAEQASLSDSFEVEHGLTYSTKCSGYSYLLSYWTRGQSIPTAYSLKAPRSSTNDCNCDSWHHPPRQNPYMVMVPFTGIIVTSIRVNPQ